MKASTVIALVGLAAAIAGAVVFYRKRYALAFRQGRTAADLDQLVVQPENLNQIALDDSLIPLPQVSLQ